VSDRAFYGKRRQTVIVPVHPAVSDDDDEEESDNDDYDVADPDFVLTAHDHDIPGPSDMGPSAKRRRRQPAVQVLQEEEEEEEDEEKEEGNDDAKRPFKPSKSAARPTTWHKVDVKNAALPKYQHSPPDYIETPFQYFTRYFDTKLMNHITHQTNVYAAQKDPNTTFTTNEEEMMTFVAILIYMGLVPLSAVKDYWAMETRVPQVANLMSSDRFKLLKRVVHFCDNSEIAGTGDLFFKVRPLFSSLATAFLLVPQTPKQSVDEVMVSYKGKTTGDLKQYIQNKTHQLGFKLIARASEDGFIHDMVLYQGKTTLEGHDVCLTPEQRALGASSQIVSVLASSMSYPTTTAIFADHFFSSLELVRYLRDQDCRYTGTARGGRIGRPPLKAVKELEKKTVPRGTCDYVTSDDGILAVRWKDNQTVTLLSTDVGVEPMSSVVGRCRETETKTPVSCPAVVRRYNANMAGIDKSDALLRLYSTPMKSRRWYMVLFAFCIDVSLTNAWLLCRRDCKALSVNGPSLKEFRLAVSRAGGGQRPAAPSSQRRSLDFVEMPTPVRGHRSHTPNDAERFDVSLFHAPVYAKRQTCKYCSRKGNIIRSNLVCKVCKVHLCINGERNCFINYHEYVA